ncbi:basigin [Copidosoma floridanum]|uniref:basigin n=1 Tax=Copidosoma floridanum TaxID=29053 RepID=UPI0006C977F9|nr:basigin [Copidosoma floridanum]
MESLAAFVMIGLLLLASNLVEVESSSIKYVGDTLVRDGQPWNITCSGVPASATIMWKRNGQPLVEDLASGIMHVEPPKVVDGYITSSLIATTTLERHEGSYVCTESNETHYLAIVYDVTMKVLTKNDTVVVLDCPDRQGGEKFEWFKDGKPLVDTDLLKSKNGSLTVMYGVDGVTVFGNYSCRVGNVSADYRIVRKPDVVMHPWTNVVEGEKLHLTCSVKTGDPGLKILWMFQDHNYTAPMGRVKLNKDEERNINNAIFIVDEVKQIDKGTVSCIAYYTGVTDPQYSDEASTVIRVKGRLDAIYPFLGICAEVIILCLIIVIYEKKRNKSELEESDTDQSPDTKPTPNKDSDVRQRK